MNEDLMQAKAMLDAEGYTCVLRRKHLSYTSKERGITPLLLWLETGMDFKNAVSADKVVGKAAPYLYVLLGVSEIYAYVISQPALDLLKRYNVQVEYETLVPAVRNRTGNGFCPMETAVLAVDEPKEALEILRAKRAEMLQQMAVNKEEA